jgi:hypothetical protein
VTAFLDALPRCHSTSEIEGHNEARCSTKAARPQSGPPRRGPSPSSTRAGAELVKAQAAPRGSARRRPPLKPGA